jgi:hypothetical protein
VTRQPDAPQPQAQPPRDLQLDDREADRQADAAPQHDIEERVPGVVELRRRWAAEAGFPIEDVVEPVEDDVAGIARVEPEPDPRGQRVEDRERRVGVDVRTAIGGDDEGAERQVEVRLGRRHDAGELRLGRRAGGLVVRHPGIVRRAPRIGRNGHPSMGPERGPWYAA